MNETIATRDGKIQIVYVSPKKKAHTHNIKLKINQSLETTKSYQKKKKKHNKNQKSGKIGRGGAW